MNAWSASRVLVAREYLALLIELIACYLFDGKRHRLYRYLIPFLSACELASAERLISSSVLGIAVRRSLDRDGVGILSTEWLASAIGRKSSE